MRLLEPRTVARPLDAVEGEIVVGGGEFGRGERERRSPQPT